MNLAARMKWHDAKKDPPTQGERVIVDADGFVGEAYLNATGRWIRYGAVDLEMMLGHEVVRWMPMPESRNSDRCSSLKKAAKGTAEFFIGLTSSFLLFVLLLSIGYSAFGIC